jgi:hypothetical protein
MTTDTNVPAQEPKKRGRPTRYDPAMCEQVIELGAQGKSRTQISAELDIHPRLLAHWEEAHEDFRHALELSRVKAMAHWEMLAATHLIEIPGGPKVNTGLWSRSMAARFPEHYRENSKVEVTGKNDGAIQVDVVHDFAQELVQDLLASRQDDAESK